MFRTGIISLFCLYISVSSAYAAEHKFDISFDMASYRYEEPSMPMKLEGFMYGVTGEYQLKHPFKSATFNDLSFFALQLTYMQGKNDYTGFIQDTSGNNIGDLKVDNIEDYYVEGRLLGGIAYQFSPTVGFRTYTGFAMRWLVNRFNEKSDDYGYRRTSTYYYLPIGVVTEITPAETWKISVTGEFDWFLRGYQESRLGDVNPTFYPNMPNSVENRQNKGYGLRASVRVDKQFSAVAGLFFEPFIKYWNIGNSEDEQGSAGTVFEPKNNTREIGCRIGVSF